MANLNQALRLNPNFAEAYVELGLIALAQGRVEEGIGALEKAVSLDPQACRGALPAGPGLPADG